jgi:hypothetical protein
MFNVKSNVFYGIVILNGGIIVIPTDGNSVGMSTNTLYGIWNKKNWSRRGEYDVISGGVANGNGIYSSCAKSGLQVTRGNAGTTGTVVLRLTWSDQEHENAQEKEEEGRGRSFEIVVFH